MTDLAAPIEQEDNEQEQLFRRVYRLARSFMGEGQSLRDHQFVRHDDDKMGPVRWLVRQVWPSANLDRQTGARSDMVVTRSLSEASCLSLVFSLLKDEARRAFAFVREYPVTDDVSPWYALSVRERNEWILRTFGERADVTDAMSDFIELEDLMASNSMSTLRLAAPGLVVGDWTLVAPAAGHGPGAWLVSGVDGVEGDLNEVTFVMTQSAVFDACHDAATNRAIKLYCAWFANMNFARPEGVDFERQHSWWDQVVLFNREGWIAKALKVMAEEVQPEAPVEMGPNRGLPRECA